MEGGAIRYHNDRSPMGLLNVPTTFLTDINFMSRVDVLIEQNLDNEAFCIADFEQSLFMSSSQIYRKIKHASGLSPSVYVRRKRLQYAHALVLQSDLSLSEISHRVGFNGLSYFSRCFSNLYGTAPSRLSLVGC